MTPDLRARVLAAVARDPAPTRDEARRAARLAVAAAVACTVTLFLLAGGVRPTDRPLQLILVTTGLAALVAVVAAGVAVRRAPSPRGRSPQALVALLVAVPLALVAGKLMVSAAWPGMTEWWPPRPGLRCMGLFLALGAAPLAASSWIWRHREVHRSALGGAALGVACGAAAWMLVDLWCPVAHPAHLALGHLLPLALLGAAGALARLARRN